MAILSVPQRTGVITDSFTRPANTTAYTIGDVVGPITTAAVQILAAAALANGGSGYITKVRLMKEGATVTSATFRVYFYSVAPTAITDNAAWTVLYADRAKEIGYVDLATMAIEVAGSDAAEAFDMNVRIPFVCAATDTRLYAVITARAAYTPASSEKFFLEVAVERN